jgi:hypothetical protein
MSEKCRHGQTCRSFDYLVGAAKQREIISPRDLAVLMLTINPTLVDCKSAGLSVFCPSEFFQPRHRPDGNIPFHWCHN